jgi:hypothetical protein
MEQKAMINPPTQPNGNSTRRIRVSLGLALFGLFVFVLGARPALFGLDRSPVVGFVQLAVLLVGLGFICLGGFISMRELWPSRKLSILADVGLRLVATGYLVALFSGLADVFGFGSQSLPLVPHFGEWQAMGVTIGEAIIGIGFLLMIPFGGGKATQRVEETPAKTADKPAASSMS